MINTSVFKSLFSGKTEGETPTSPVPGVVLKNKVIKVETGAKEKEKEKGKPVPVIAKPGTQFTKTYDFNRENGNLIIRKDSGEVLELDIPFTSWREFPTTPVINKEQFGQAASKGGFSGIDVMQKSRYTIADELEKAALAKGAKYKKA